MGRRAIEAKKDRQARQAVEAAAALRPPRKRPAPPAGRTFAIDIARLAEDDKCQDVLVLDLTGLSAFCDYFVIATGTSDRQMRAVSDHIDDLARQRGERLFTSAGRDDAQWVVLDYVDVVIHLFSGDSRQYYELEELWGDAPRIDWQR